MEKLNNNISFLIDGIDEKKSIDVHIRVQQRNGKKCITTVENLDKLNNDKDFLESIAKEFRQSFKCSSTIKKPENVILMQGDHRDKIKELLLKKGLVVEQNIKIHGF